MHQQVKSLGGRSVATGQVPKLRYRCKDCIRHSDMFLEYHNVLQGRCFLPFYFFWMFFFVRQWKSEKFARNNSISQDVLDLPHALASD